MALINNKKTYKSKNLTEDGIIKVVDQSFIKLAWRLKDKSSKINQKKGHTQTESEVIKKDIPCKWK